jgi:hypothetical protein
MMKWNSGLAVRPDLLHELQAPHNQIPAIGPRHLRNKPTFVGAREEVAFFTGHQYLQGRRAL